MSEDSPGFLEKHRESWKILKVRQKIHFLNREHETIGENRVVVPEAFFKVILCLQGVPKAIGYVVRNNEGKRKLPDSIENEVEAHASLEDWR